MDTISRGFRSSERRQRTDTARWGAYAVVVRAERSQHQNRRLALARLQALADADAAEAQAARDGQAHWLHHQVQRGDPVRVFDGPGFVEKGRVKLMPSR
ncbi:hypothetical protein SAMN04488078_103049 [Antarctobacter heliothermus]|uniref:Uncharacterized protein n=1 Tax=Antarctobacter heliothermus TaxID=74033 RepID=A0A239H6C8_9RHOB|nr:hypothetical protein SAMN04488078_103049 [Antarctobacter heliothermus]